MALTVTDAFKAAWGNKTWAGHRRTVRIKRRYWNGAAYTHEAAFQTLRADQVKRVDPIPQTVDAELEAIFDIPEFGITVASPNGEFLVSPAPPSFFAADATSGEDGYEALYSEVEVDFTLLLQDGTEETITVFSGVLVDDPELDTEGLTARLLVAGNGRLIADSDAAAVSDAVTLEDCIPPVGDGTNTAFTTTSKGVAAVTDLQVDGVSLTQGRDNDWTVDNVGEDVPADFDVRTTPAPPLNDTVKWSGRKWKQDISVEDFVDAVLDNAGFPAGKREISPFVYPGGLAGFKRITTQGEWEAGSVLTGIDTKTVVASIRKRYHIDYLDSLAAWTVASGSWGVAGQVLTGSGAISVPYTHAGTLFYYQWVANVGTTLGPFGYQDGQTEVVILGSAASPGNGYALRVGCSSSMLGGPTTSYVLVRYDAGVATILADTNVSSTDNGSHTWRIHRSAGGAITVYKDGAVLLTATDTTYTTGSYVSLTADYSTNFSAFQHDDQLAVTYESVEFNLLSAPSSWGTFDYSHTLNGGSVAYATNAAAASGGPYDGYVAINGSTAAIESTERQYLKLRAIITPSTTPFTSPEISDIQANFMTTAIFITVANLEGLDADSGGGWAALERYVGPTGYALMLRGNGNLALRPKDVLGDPVADLTQDNCLVKLLSYDHGSKRVRNVGRVRYSGYVSEYDGADAGEASPTSEQQYQRRAKEVNYDRVLYANDVNIGAAQAAAIYEANYRRKRRWSFQCHYVPWLEVLDRVTITYLRDPLAADPRPGDPLLDGQPSYRLPVAGTPSHPLFVNQQLCRVLSYTPDLDALDEGVLYVEEILDD